MFVYERITIHITGRYVGILPAVCQVARTSRGIQTRVASYIMYAGANGGAAC